MVETSGWDVPPRLPGQSLTRCPIQQSAVYLHLGCFVLVHPKNRHCGRAANSAVASHVKWHFYTLNQGPAGYPHMLGLQFPLLFINLSVIIFLFSASCLPCLAVLEKHALSSIVTLSLIMTSRHGVLRKSTVLVPHKHTVSARFRPLVVSFCM